MSVQSNCKENVHLDSSNNRNWTISARTWKKAKKVLEKERCSMVKVIYLRSVNLQSVE